MTADHWIAQRLRDYIQARPKLRYWCSVRWPVANLLDRLHSQCWADLVMWALNWFPHETPLWRPFRGGGQNCRRDSMTHRDACCYCGKFKNGRRGERP